MCRNLDKALAGELFGSAPRKPRDVRMHIKLLRHKPKFAGAEEYRIAEAIVVLAKLGKLADKRDIKLSHLDYRRLELEVGETALLHNNGLHCHAASKCSSIDHPGDFARMPWAFAHPLKPFWAVSMES